MENRESQKKVLIIDDNKPNVEIITSYLIDEGYDVDIAYDGKAGIQKVKEFLPDLILLDVMMPYLNGYEVCRKLRSQEQSRFVPIILITALSNPDEKVKGLEAGADDFLIKPLNFVEMLARIRNLLRSREQLEKQRRRDQYEAEIARELDLREYRVEEEARRKRFYREVIYAVTNGKLQLIDREEIGDMREGEEELGNLEIERPEEVGKARQFAEELAKSFMLPPEVVRDVTLCVSEAATNVIKHGDRGVMRVAKRNNVFRIWVEDSGPGIEFTNLPRATLLRGFSTKPSFGYGFKIMLELLDALLLCTDAKGTVLCMEVGKVRQGQKGEDIDQFLSTWKESG